MKKRVLVVDDERLIADTLGIIFQQRGFECRVSYTGEDALACPQDFCPELLLCDIAMPGMNGMELAWKVTQRWPDCRVLMLTGNFIDLPSARKWAGSQLLRSRIMTKPVPPALLLKEADALLLQ